MSAVYAWPHSWTPIGHDLREAWHAYAAIASGGGTPPQWTTADDPQTAVPPPDAAGGLWRVGDTPTVPPTIAHAAEQLRSALDLGPEWAVDAVSGYFSSGGRGVFLICVRLVEDPTIHHYYATVWRAVWGPRIGASERNYRGGTESVLFPDDYGDGGDDDYGDGGDA